MVGDQSAVTRGRTGPSASQGCVQRCSRIGPRGNGMSPCYRALLRRRGLSSPNGGRNGAAGDRRLDNKGGLSPVSEATGAVYLSFFSSSFTFRLEFGRWLVKCAEIRAVKGQRTKGGRAWG